jgi:hypothetical protein
LCDVFGEWQELLKYTPEEHPDHAQAKAALEKVQGVVEEVNKKKRDSENLQKILEIQGQISNISVPTPLTHDTHTRHTHTHTTHNNTPHTTHTTHTTHTMQTTTNSSPMKGGLTQRAVGGGEHRSWASRW